MPNRSALRDFYLEVVKGNIDGHKHIHKFGRNPDIDDASGFEAIWNGGGDYTGQDPTVAETLQTFSSSANDAGTVVSSGTATGGSKTTLIDSIATFQTDGVAVSDVIINDTDQSHGIVTAVTSETTLTVERFDGNVSKTGGIFESSDAYRVASPSSTGAAVIKLLFLLDASYVENTEYIVLNGVTAVDTSGTYIRHSRGKVIQCGSNNSNVGTITSRQKTTTANVTMVMPIGYNETMIAAYTVPAGKTGYMIHSFMSLSGSGVGISSVISNGRLLFRAINEVFRVKEEKSIVASGTSDSQRPFFLPKDDIPEKTDIKVVADTDTDNTGIASGFDLITIDNQ